MTGAEGQHADQERELITLSNYIENAGDFVIPLSAGKDVHSEKVVLDMDRLDLRLRDAIRHARDSEDPNFEASASEEDE